MVAGVLCGAAASGQFTWTPENVGKSLLCMFMSGPLLTGYTQVKAPVRRSPLIQLQFSSVECCYGHVLQQTHCHLPYLS